MEYKETMVTMTEERYQYLLLRDEILRKMTQNNETNIVFIRDYEGYSDYGKILYKTNDEAIKELKSVLEGLITFNNTMKVPIVKTENWLRKLLSEI